MCVCESSIGEVPAEVLTPSAGGGLCVRHGIKAAGGGDGGGRQSDQVKLRSARSENKRLRFLFQERVTFTAVKKMIRHSNSSIQIFII